MSLSDSLRGPDPGRKESFAKTMTRVSVNVLLSSSIRKSDFKGFHGQLLKGGVGNFEVFTNFTV